MAATRTQPLSPIAMIFLPLLMLFQRGAMARQRLQRRAEIAHKRKEQQIAQRQLVKLLAVEAKQFEQIMQESLSRQAYAHLVRQDHESASGTSKRKVQRVRFEFVKTSPEIIYFKILTRRKTMFGFKNALPYKVRVIDLVHEDTLQELSYACERVVTAVYEDPRKGAWFRIHRLEGIGGIATKVLFKDMLKHYPEDMSKAPLILGVGEHRKVYSVDLASHPHALIGGTSGGGKSNMINHIIASLMRFTTPEEVKFVLIDLKRMEFGFYRDAPHLYKPVIMDPKNAIDTLRELLKDVHKRADLLSKHAAKELSIWNKRYPDKALPRIIVVIDEFAELMLASGPDVAKETENLVARISNLGRAVGIHLLVCTQRPAVKVLPNAIKINMPLIMSAKTPNAQQSAVIIGTGAAANLPMIPGRMLYLSGAFMREIQTPYISDEDVVECVRIARGKAEGAIRLDATAQPTVIPDGLLKLVAKLGGSLSGKMAHKLLDYGISREMFKAFAKDLIHKGEVELETAIYIVVKKGNSYQVETTEIISDVEIEHDPIPEPEPEIKVDVIEVDITAEPYREILALPVPKVEPEPAIEVEITETDYIQQFLDRKCKPKPKAKILTRDLYKAYSAWAESEQMTPVNTRAFGIWLNEHNYSDYRAGGMRYRLGIELVPDVPDVSLVPNVPEAA